MNIIQDILNKWIEVTNYDADQHRFNLLSSNYQFHKCGERITQLLEFDSSGTFAVLYAKASFETVIKSINVSLLNYCKNPDLMKDYLEMWKSFECKEVTTLEQTLLQNIYRIIGGGTLSLPSEESDDKSMDYFRDSIEYIAEELPRCNEDLFLRGGKIITDGLKMCSEIHVFNTIAQCLITIEGMNDGLYLCYISDNNSAGGHFGYFLKSNGNIICINDRVDEMYVSQHSNSRNNRWVDDKRTNIFPYSVMVEVGKRCYLGYAKEMKVKYDVFKISELDDRWAFPVLLAGSLILNKYRDRDTSDMSLKYVDSMLKVNHSSAEIAALVPVSESKLMTMYDSLNITITADQVLGAKLHGKFDYSENINKPGRNYKNTGHYRNINSSLVTKYGDGFELQDDTILKRYPMITDGKNNSYVVSEFVGDEHRIEMEMYRQSRMQLHSHILRKMAEEYETFGGMDGIKKWYHDLCTSNFDMLVDKMVEYYVEIVDGHRKNRMPEAFCISCADELEVGYTISETTPWNAAGKDFILNPDKIDWQRCKCPITGCLANVWFTVSPNRAFEISKLFGIELPKVMEGWYAAGDSTGDKYAGNNLIDSCDPVGFIAHPLSYDGRRYHSKYFPGCSSYYFHFSIGLSKRGLNQKVKEYRAKLAENKIQNT